MSAYWTMEFERKAVLVTGAGSGIGFAVCRAFASAGALVALNDMDATLAAQAAATLNGSLPVHRVTPYGLDVADVVALQAMVDQFAGQCGRLDVAVANAGLTTYSPFLDTTVSQFDRVTSVNLRGTYFTAQAAARQMIKLGVNEGRIILLSSVTGYRALSQLSAYGVTKAGVSHMAKVLALELAPYGITVNAIAPGATVTERTVEEDPEYVRHWSAVTPSGRTGEVTDVAAAALFLASSRASHITGQTLIVDGGWTLQSPMPPSS